MGKYIISEVNDANSCKLFINLPLSLYKNCTEWVAPLNSDIEKVFDPNHNKMFAEGEAIRYVVVNSDNGECVGRIAAFYNIKTAAQNDSQGALKVGGCGFYDAIDDFDVAKLLFDSAKKWLQTKGMEAMDGPINFGDREMWWGLLTFGFEQPVYGMNYNFPYYKEHFERYGFKNFFNGLSYNRDLRVDNINPAVLEKGARIKANKDYTIRYIPKKELFSMAEAFTNIYKSAWEKFEGIAQITKEQTEAMMRNMMPIIDEKLIYFAFYKEEPIGFFIMVPDLNSIIKDFKGKFGLINKLKFLYRLKIKKSSRIAQGLVFGIKSEHQSKGVEGGIISYCAELIAQGELNYDKLELTWMGDFNPLMIRMVESYVGATHIKTHATYRVLFDPERPFERAKKVSVARTKKIINN